MKLSVSEFATRPGAPPRLLVVGAGDAGWLGPLIDGVTVSAFGDVGAEILWQTRAEIVLSALVTAEFDAVDLAIRLDGLGYDGRYRAVVLADEAPCPALVVREVNTHAPGLDFAILAFSMTAGVPDFREIGG